MDDGVLFLLSVPFITATRPDNTHPIEIITR